MIKKFIKFLEFFRKKQIQSIVEKPIVEKPIVDWVWRSSENE